MVGAEVESLQWRSKGAKVEEERLEPLLVRLMILSALCKRIKEKSANFCQNGFKSSRVMKADICLETSSSLAG